jgi:hypothetical protein
MRDKQVLKQIETSLLSLNDEQKKQGLNWYKDIHDYCRLVSDMYSIELWKVCAILSALSPNNRFYRNVIDVISLIKHKGNAKVCTYNSNKQKALKCLEANSFDECLKLFKGRKTLSFFLNIYKPLSNDRVTIDVWMIRYFDIKGSLTDKKYRQAETIVKQCADKLNMLPHQLQALLWIAARGNAY